MYFAVSISELERAFLAGFLEGEATPRIPEHERRTVARVPMYPEPARRRAGHDGVAARATGLGRIHRVPARATSQPQLCWAIDAQDDCRELLAMIESCGFHGRRAAELRSGVKPCACGPRCDGAARRSRLCRLETELAAARRFGGGEPVRPRDGTARSQLWGYISGFVCAEGCFGTLDGPSSVLGPLRQDDEPLLRAARRGDRPGQRNALLAQPAAQPVGDVD